MYVYMCVCVCGVYTSVYVYLGVQRERAWLHQYLTVVDTESVLVLFILMISHIPEVSIMDVYKRVQNKRFASIFFLSNHQISDMGGIELVEIDGKKYTVSVLYASTLIDDDYMQDSLKYLKEFNEKNNITPIQP